MNLADLVGFYVDRLISQYRGQVRASATVAIAVKQALGDDLASQVQEGFNLDTAIGTQLDVLGKYIGTTRNIGRSTAPGLFSLWTYASTLLNANYKGTWDPATNTPAIPAAAGGNAGWWYVASGDGHSTAPIVADFKCGDIITSDGAVWTKDVADCGNGLNTYTDLAVNANGVFWSYASASRAFSNLSDESYRTVLKLKAILNHNDGTLASIVALLNTFFPGLIQCVDNTDMTLTYLVVNTVPLSVDILAAFLPKPMGVGINIVIVNPSPEGGGRLTTEGGDSITTEDGDHIVLEA